MSNWLPNIACAKLFPLDLGMIIPPFHLIWGTVEKEDVI